MITLYKALAEQTIFDVALQHFGDIEGLAFILEDNPTIINADGLFDLSKPISIRDEIINLRVIESFKGYVPVTGGLVKVDYSVLIDENLDFLEDNDTNVLFGQ